MYDDFKDARVDYRDGVYTVTIGSVMPDWQKHEMIMKFREAFQSSDIVIKQTSGTNISGEASITHHI